MVSRSVPHTASLGEPPALPPEDPLAPVRGIALGVVLSTPLWAGILWGVVRVLQVFQ
jgi:hypothetical protein